MTLIAFAMLLASLVGQPHEVRSTLCTQLQVDLGHCSADQLGSMVVVRVGTEPGIPPSGEVSDAEQQARWSAYLQSLVDQCRASAAGELAADRCDVIVVGPGTAPATDGVPPITMSDLARFRPIVGELIVEPSGWAVVGTSTNFYATAETHSMDGELFDTPIQVRWTPSAYRFDYGDGAVEETEVPGAAWNGVEESWTETTTSHTYATREDVTASVTVVFTAEVNAGSGWFSVPGTLPIVAPAVGVKVFEVDTVLTDGDCMANPSAAGCGG